MATELTVQSERAFQKQPHIFLNSKSRSAKSKRVGKGGRRWFKDVGLGFRTPKTAIDGTYIGTLAVCGSAAVGEGGADVSLAPQIGCLGPPKFLVFSIANRIINN